MAAEAPRCPFTGLTAAESEEGLRLCREHFQQPRPDGSLTRQFHALTHACLRATLELSPPADSRWRHGLFARAARYDCVMRFSASFFGEDEPDARGLAIKLLGVDGPVCEGAPAGQQDFVLINDRRAANADPLDFLELLRHLSTRCPLTPHSLLAPGYVMPGLRPWRIRWRYLWFLMLGGLRHARRQGLGAMRYDSTTPYRLGDGATRYVLRPETPTGRVDRCRVGEGLTRQLQRRLDHGPLRFEFCLQPRQHPADSLDDATRPWRSPLVRVGRIEVPGQNVADGLALGERLAFSPWNALTAHAPLGALNAYRRLAYAASARNRSASAVLDWPADWPAAAAAGQPGPGTPSV